MQQILLLIFTFAPVGPGGPEGPGIPLRPYNTILSSYWCEKCLRELRIGAVEW